MRGEIQPIDPTDETIEESLKNIRIDLREAEIQLDTIKRNPLGREQVQRAEARVAALKRTFHTAKVMLEYETKLIRTESDT